MERRRKTTSLRRSFIVCACRDVESSATQSNTRFWQTPAAVFDAFLANEL